MPVQLQVEGSHVAMLATPLAGTKPRSIQRDFRDVLPTWRMIYMSHSARRADREPPAGSLRCAGRRPFGFSQTKPTSIVPRLIGEVRLGMSITKRSHDDNGCAETGGSIELVGAICSCRDAGSGAECSILRNEANRFCESCRNGWSDRRTGRHWVQPGVRSAETKRGNCETKPHDYAGHARWIDHVKLTA
jgi:hypothetical protein